MNIKDNVQSLNQQIFLPILEEKNIELFIKREDLIHPFVSGNKYRKLKYNLQKAKHLHKKVVLTFGGAFSNHIVATAVAANTNGLQSIGVIRGDELENNISNTLKNNSSLQIAHQHGMIFHFVSRESYRNKTNPFFINQLQQKYGDFYLIPEGGTNQLAIKGCEEILTNNDAKFNYICCAVGTGGTIAGLINSVKKHQKIIGFSALKGDFLAQKILKLACKKNWHLQAEYHFGGYAKYSEELIHFINTFKSKTDVLLDPIYTAKMMFGILDLVKTNTFAKSTKILAIHTGGIQAIDGFNKKLSNKNLEIIKSKSI